MKTRNTSKVRLLLQEIPLDDPESRCYFVPSLVRPLVATPAALRMYGWGAILRCLRILQKKAEEHQGLDYLQVFEDPDKPSRLWFMDDAEAVTALLPSDH